jgi:hypothetical protein
MDEPIGIKIPDTEASDMAETFRVLSGIEPSSSP